nr:hypothetical protein C4D60_Mb02t03040 [Ipomoea batatas]
MATSKASVPKRSTTRATVLDFATKDLNASRNAGKEQVIWSDMRVSILTIGVATPNGDTQFTLTPYLPNSTPKFLVKPTTACFDAEYSCGTWPCVTEATLEVKITLPFLAGIMTRAACFAHRKAPNTLASNTCLKLLPVLGHGGVHRVFHVGFASHVAVHVGNGVVPNFVTDGAAQLVLDIRNDHLRPVPDKMPRRTFANPAGPTRYHSNFAR